MTYDDWKATAPVSDEDRPAPCPVCTGDHDAEPCSEECAELVAMRRCKLAEVA